jgi:multicomponent K+:H+ antiporter subunit A
VLLSRYRSVAALVTRLPSPDAKRLFDATMAQTVAALRRLLGVIHVASLQRYLLMLFAVALAFGIEAALRNGIYAGTRPTTPASPSPWLPGSALVAATIAVVTVDRRRYLALIFISVIGLVMALAFIHLSAPDLALTQISVEVVTILLMLLALHLLPGNPPRLSALPRRLRDAAIAVAGVWASDGWPGR